MATDSIVVLFQPTLEAAWLDLQYISADQLGLPTTDWSDYAPERNLLVLNSRMLESLGVAAIERWRGMFLGYAQGDALTILAEETYRSPRLAASYASCEGEFVNTTLTTYTVDAGDYVTVKSSERDDVRYRVEGPLSIPPGTTGGFTATATTAGSIGNALAGEIDEIEGNAFPGVTFANTSAAEGRDGESDPDLASRARLAITALSIAGPIDAYEYFARGGERNGEVDEDIATIGVTRVRTYTALSDGKVSAFFATPTGGVSGTATTGNLGLINAKILLRVVPTGTDYEGDSATPVIIDLDYVAYVPDNLGIDPDELKAAIEARFVEYISTLPVGGPPEITPTPGYTGSITTSKTRGIITEADINGVKPVSDAVHSINLATEQLIAFDEAPVPGTITGTVTFQPPQAP